MDVSAFPVIVGHSCNPWCPSASFRSDDVRMLFAAGQTGLHGGSGSKTGRRTAGSHGRRARDGQRVKRFESMVLEQGLRAEQRHDRESEMGRRQAWRRRDP